MTEDTKVEVVATEATPVAETKPAKVKKEKKVKEPKPPKAPTKADKVREMIATAKANGVEAKDLIASVVTELGFSRQLAKAYIDGNWNKVVVEGVAEAVTAATGETAAVEDPTVAETQPAQ
jgi:hypothetical protein